MLYVFDLDGTLIRSFMREGGGADEYDLVEVLPGRRERLHELLADGHRIAGATNQGGVAFGYQTEEQVARKMDRVRDQLGLAPRGRFPIYACLHHPHATVEAWRQDPCPRRKPAPGLILDAMRDAGVGERDTLYVGDMESDREAAWNAGVEYRDAADFFGAMRGEP